VPGLYDGRKNEIDKTTYLGHIKHMIGTFEEISRHSVQLPRSKRLALARFLLELDDPAEDKDASALWHTEILKRAQAVEEGKTEGISYGDALERIDAVLKR